MHATRAAFVRALAALFVGALLLAPRAYADACSAATWPDSGPGIPSGACTEFGTYAPEGTGTVLSLWRERASADRIPTSRVEALRDDLLGRIGPGVLRALSSLPGMRLPPQVHIVLVGERPGTDERPIYARTLPMPDSSPPACYVVLFNEPARLADGEARTIAHELFHCAQYHTWPRAEGGAPSLWWREGSAVWFEDLALPRLEGSSNLRLALTLFRDRSSEHSLLEGTYSNVVFFSWLGADRMVSYLEAVATSGGSQLFGATRALPEDEYRRFAQDYVDEQITTPSGVRMAGAVYGPIVRRVHETTGTPGRDPAYVGPRVQPLTLVRGEVLFRPANYAPSGRFGDEERVFSVEHAGWTRLPEAIMLPCGGERHVRFGAMSTREAGMEVEPNTLAAGVPPGSCTCPVGTWTITADDLQNWLGTPSEDVPSRTIEMRHSGRTITTPAARRRQPGDPGYQSTSGAGGVAMTFNADHTAHFEGSGIRIQSSVSARSASGSTVITKSYSASWSWAIDRYGLITLTPTRPMVVREDIYERGTVVGMRTESRHRSRRYEPAQDNDALPRPFECRGDTLLLGRPVAVPRIGAEVGGPASERRRQRVTAELLPAEVNAQREGHAADAPLNPTRKRYPVEGRYVRAH